MLDKLVGITTAPRNQATVEICPLYEIGASGDFCYAEEPACESIVLSCVGQAADDHWITQG